MRHPLAPLALLATSLTVSGVLAAPTSDMMRHARPLFLALPNNAPGHLAPVSPAAQLPQWNGSFVDHKGKTVNYTMVGTDPATNNASTTIPVVIIPIRMVYGAANGNTVFDPVKAKLPNGQLLLSNFLRSPLFKAKVTYVQGGVNLGTAQYIDAFQRGNFWSFVRTNTQYHVRLGSPTVLPEQKITVLPGEGDVEANPFAPPGVTANVGTMEYQLFDRKLQKFITNLPEINPGVLPIFLTQDIYLTEGICCIGGYHSANGSQPAGQTYAYATYVDTPGAFSEDVSAFSHEIGEWMDDPFIDNVVNCKDNSIMEDGDPLENNANYGAYRYRVNGFTYNLQSLVFIGYFGAPPSTSVNNWLSFQNDEPAVCPGQ
jgi:hypothetical protein